MRHAARYVNEREIAEFSVGAVETRGQLGGELKHEARAFARDLAESRIGHLGDFALGACPYPGTAGGLFVEKAHLTEELSFVQVSQDHLITVFVLDHDFDRAVDDVMQNVRQIAGMNHYSFLRYRPHAAITQKSVNCRYIAQIFRCCLHRLFLAPVANLF